MVTTVALLTSDVSRGRRTELGRREKAVVREMTRKPENFEVGTNAFLQPHQLRGYKGSVRPARTQLPYRNLRAGAGARQHWIARGFVELKAAADEVVQYLDHRNINELDPFVELQPSAENLAKYILERVAARVGDDRVQIFKVRCFETPTSVATYQLD